MYRHHKKRRFRTKASASLIIPAQAQQLTYQAPGGVS
jgi:hypothetical protein